MLISAIELPFSPLEEEGLICTIPPRVVANLPSI